MLTILTATSVITVLESYSPTTNLRKILSADLRARSLKLAKKATSGWSSQRIAPSKKYMKPRPVGPHTKECSMHQLSMPEKVPKSVLLKITHPQT
jgi:hypothetical protein